MSEEPGRERVIAGRYRLLSPLGEGGMGTVWRARDEVLHREVAVKEVRAPAGLPAAEVERMYTRLEREAWAAARVANRNVVTVYDVAHQDGRPWIVMELIRGIALSDLLDAEGPVSPQRAAYIGAEVLSALRAAHAAGVLHRDVKPANVLLSNDDRVVLTDFGIATVEGSSALTMTGEVIGSPEFLAPERALGRTPGPESDLWSLGVLLYAAVEGNSPFRQNTPLSTLRAVVDEELPSPRRAGPLTPVIEGLLRKDPAERIPAEQAERDLRIIGAGGTPRTGVPASSYAPTVTAFPAGSPTPPLPTPAPVGATGPAHPAQYAPPPRNRRAAVVLVAGLAVLALALAGLTYGLVHHNDGSGGGSTTGSGAPHSDTAGGGSASSPGRSTGAGPGPTGASSVGGGSGHTTSPSAQSVQVTVTGTHTDYSGTCPPPDAEAPTFTATFTVGSVPAEVSYRWVTTSGQVSDPGWKTLSFPAGGKRTKQRQVVVTTYDPAGSVHNAIGVEVRSPVQVTSGTVPFTVTCGTETPTGGASPSSS
ncbi:serine/threonine-protein kinase [Streptomyces gibsoniae]|uniref:non-specific serine/threonine protein kinase n=1 Tax=Streptomyces gibsoniae TaxID=3075529 RepID=A0ABU2TWA6_9ACTN|nr:serine/threonine-protein kinase [Streptomyces sp. DSM 41699]MDT0465245.1 serine/threonine-protein kinase [Streptomyces sp. DSM 41699]